MVEYQEWAGADPDCAGRLDDVPFMPAGEEPAREPVRFKSVAEFLAEYVPLSYAVEPIVRSGSLYTLTARTGAGKTALFIVMALAIASGRSDLLGVEAEPGRVALLTFENPDDVRMRMLIAAFALNIDLRDIAGNLEVLDKRARPEDITAQLDAMSQSRPFRLILVDTLAAFFDGDNINDAVQGGNFMRRMRPMTRLPELPAVLVAAHPVKNAAEDNLLPYGSGAILNEVDGNLMLWRKAETGASVLHWQGKLRGLEFNPIAYKVEVTGCPAVLDTKDRQVQLPYFVPIKEGVAEMEARAKADSDTGLALLRAMMAHPTGTQRDWAAAIDRVLSNVSARLPRLAREKLVECINGKWRVTPKGIKEVERWSP